VTRFKAIMNETSDVTSSGRRLRDKKKYILSCTISVNHQISGHSLSVKCRDMEVRHRSDSSLWNGQELLDVSCATGILSIHDQGILQYLSIFNKLSNYIRECVQFEHK